jgi:CPA1 family monovalent cation:H+ antiporter
VVLAALIAVRMAWMFSIPVFVRVARRGEPPQTRAELTVLGWSGMRGGVSLAAALALPLTAAPTSIASRAEYTSTALHG